MHREKMNKSMTMNHNVNAETVENIASELDALRTEVAKVQAQKQHILKVCTLPRWYSFWNPKVNR